MGNLLRLAMGRLMSTKQGFTLVETLFTLVILCMMSLMTMTFHHIEYRDELYIDQISQFLRSAQLNAMSNKGDVSVYFKRQSIEIKSDDFSRTYHLPRHIWFDKHQLKFNEYGHIYNAKSIKMHSHTQTFSFVYQVGSGFFYVQ